MFDRRTVLKILPRRIEKDLGWEVEQATTAGEFCDKLEAGGNDAVYFEPHLLIRLSNQEYSRRALGLLSEIPVIVSSTTSREDTPLSFEPVAYLDKPHSLREVYGAMRTVEEQLPL